MKTRFKLAMEAMMEQAEFSWFKLLYILGHQGRISIARHQYRRNEAHCQHSHCDGIMELGMLRVTQSHGGLSHGVIDYKVNGGFI